MEFDSVTRIMLICLCIFGIIWETRGAAAPFIRPCPTNDLECVVVSAQAAVPHIASGVPQLGIKSLDPMYIDQITSNESGLILQFKNTVVTGMKGCVVDGFKQDLTKGKQQTTLRCTVAMTGDYHLGGKLLVLPIQGDGSYHINIRDIVLKTTTDLEEVTAADGKKHWHITSWKHSYNTMSEATFQFDNLFNGNKVLAAPVEEFLNKNWRIVMDEVAPPIVRTIVSNVVKAVQTLYKNVPIEQLIL